MPLVISEFFVCSGSEPFLRNVIFRQHLLLCGCLSTVAVDEVLDLYKVSCTLFFFLLRPPLPEPFEKPVSTPRRQNVVELMCMCGVRSWSRGVQ